MTARLFAQSGRDAGHQGGGRRITGAAWPWQLHRNLVGHTAIGGPIHTGQGIGPMPRYANDSYQ